MVTNTFANYGLGLAELDDPVGDCVQRLEQNFAAPGFQLPMLPKTAWEVRRLTHNPQLKPEQILAVIETDATLAAELLTQARRPVHGALPLTSLKQACLRIGVNGMRDLVMQTSKRTRVFRAPEFEPKVRELMRFAQVRSRLCKAINHHSRIPQPQASMCALLADLGMATALMSLGQVSRGESAPPLAIAWQAAQESHQLIAGQVGKTWDLPEEILSVFRHHHHVYVAEVPNPTTATLLVASAVAEHLTLGLRGPDGMQICEERAEVNGARRLLGLNTDKMKRIVAQARTMQLDKVT